uniref:hypothetical protein n=1 Tax=Drechslerella dactyloides TaxID=74499 RepID=UPI0022FD95D5|nr:hypothetical protein PNX16_mgp041 [Drechslerella dactyloides]WAN89810.1 hypothetical protein [Drechslerella dactyloides]
MILIMLVIFMIKENIYQYKVSGIKNLQIIINHFDNYPLITQKYVDYILFIQAYELVKQKDHFNSWRFTKIVNIRASINKSLSEKLKYYFPNTIPVERLFIVNQKIKNPYWLADFRGGEGSFMIKLTRIFSK